MSPEGYASWCLGLIRRDIAEDKIPVYIDFSGRTELGEVQDHVVRALRGIDSPDNEQLKEELGDVAFLLYAKCALKQSRLDESWDTAGKIIKRPGVVRVVNTLALLNEVGDCIEKVTDAFKRSEVPDSRVPHMERLCVCLGWSLADVVFMNRVKMAKRVVEGTLINKEKRAK